MYYISHSYFIHLYSYQYLFATKNIGQPHTLTHTLIISYFNSIVFGKFTHKQSK